MLVTYGFALFQMLCVSDNFGCEYQPVTGRVHNSMSDCEWELRREKNQAPYRDGELICGEVKREIRR